jgi:hypothetical protein
MDARRIHTNSDIGTKKVRICSTRAPGLAVALALRLDWKNFGEMRFARQVPLGGVASAPTCVRAALSFCAHREVPARQRSGIASQGFNAQLSSLFTTHLVHHYLTSDDLPLHLNYPSLFYPNSTQLFRTIRSNGRRSPTGWTIGKT